MSAHVRWVPRHLLVQVTKGGEDHLAPHGPSEELDHLSLEETWSEEILSRNKINPILRFPKPTCRSSYGGGGVANPHSDILAGPASPGCGRAARRAAPAPQRRPPAAPSLNSSTEGVLVMAKEDVVT